MPRRYFKRHRMEYDLQRQEPPAAVLPSGFGWRNWNECSLEDHAIAKFRAFEGGVDAELFPSLGSYEGCLNLMTFISGRSDFIPRATWLVVSEVSEAIGPVPVGTIQTVCPTQSAIAIQNVGIVPEFRGQGLAKAILAKSLIAMRAEGFKRATLEVTCRNQSAVTLYERMGFAIKRTSYRHVLLPKPQSALTALGHR